MEKYLFKFNESLQEGYFENVITEDCTDPFYSQLEGIMITEEMVEENIMSISNALLLIHDIAKSDMTLWIEEEENELDILNYNLIMSKCMIEIRERIQVKGLSKKSEEKITGLHMCKYCGRHGHLLFSGKVSEEIIFKKQAIGIVQSVFSKNEISELEKKNLLKEIKESSLPDVEYRNTSMLN